MQQDIRDLIENEAPDECVEWILKFVEQISEENPLIDWQLDRPLVRMRRPDGTQFGYIDVRIGDLVLDMPEEYQP